MIAQEAQIAQQPRGLALSRNEIGRYVAAVLGVVAFFLFYQPWISGDVPGLGEQTLTGVELARGDVQDRVDLAIHGSSKPGQAAAPAAAGAGVASGAAASSGGLTLPTRIPTVAAGASGATSGGLTLPTRIPTMAAGGSTGTTGTTGTTSSASGAAASSGGLTLPTRIPTVAPGSTPQVQTQGGGTQGSVLTDRGPEIGRQVRGPAEPERLPTTLLYVVPLAAIGLAVFSAIWHRLGDPRDRLFGKLWTVLLSFGGMLAIGYLLMKLANAPVGNDLIGPGEVKATAWGLWGTFVAFTLASVSLTIAWLSPAPPSPDR